jgi:hypothetical protein
MVYPGVQTAWDHLAETIKVAFLPVSVVKTRDCRPKKLERVNVAATGQA